MFHLISLAAAVALAGGLGYLIGRRRTIGEIKCALHSDPDVGIPVLEGLARRWGARLELSEPRSGGQA